jgi:nitrite reductase (NO-forming)
MKQNFNTSRANHIWIYFIILAIGLNACSAIPGINMAQTSDTAMAATLRYTLKTGMGEGKMIFTGVGGEIDGKVNPDLHAQPGDTISITLIDGDGAMHNVSFPDFNAHTKDINGKDSQDKVEFTVKADGTFPYFCSIAGHRQAGMEGKLVVGSGKNPEKITAPSISRDPGDLPAPIGDRPAQKVRVNLEAVELEGRLADGTTYTYWTFGGQVPGPFIRIRVGDEVEVHLATKID